MDITSHPLPHAAVLHVTGELDLAVAGRPADAVRAAPAEVPLVLDRSRAAFVDASGLRAPVPAARRAR